MWSRMGIPFVVLALAFAVTFGGSALALHEGSSGTWETRTGFEYETPLPAADAGAVWQYIVWTDKYRRWPKWPGKKRYYKGAHPHGALLTTRVTRDAKKVIKKKKGIFDNGAIIVKENYMPDKTLAAITVMYKVPGYNPEAGDWFWAKYKPDGTVEKAGKVKGCIDCHRDKADNDWVFTGKITE